MVKVYEDALSKDVCQQLIKIIEEASDHLEYINDDHKPCFTQLNLNQFDMNIVRNLIPFVKKVYDTYKEDTLSFYLPKFAAMEQFRVKRYIPGGEERFDEHVDVVNYASAKRALAFLFYLNENDGSTVFTTKPYTIEPKDGTVLVFPPTWEYPHAGLPPSNTNKYILTTYLHYG